MTGLNSLNGGALLSSSTVLVHRGTSTTAPPEAATARPPAANGSAVVDADSLSTKYRKRTRSPWGSAKKSRAAAAVFAFSALLLVVLAGGHYRAPGRSHAVILTPKALGEAEVSRQKSPLSLASAADAAAKAVPRDGRRLEEVFLQERATQGRQLNEVLTRWLDQLDSDVVRNVAGGIRWVRPYLLPSLDQDDDAQSQHIRGKDHPQRKNFLNVRRSSTRMQWEDEWEELMRRSGNVVSGPAVDYTDQNKYTYPELLHELPPPSVYPPLRPLGELMSHWNHDDDYEGILHETLQHFNYSDPAERALAVQFRDAELPFKLYDIPEVTEAGRKWTADYVDAGFKDGRASGTAQESPNNFFAFYIPNHWNVLKLGLPPVRNNDWDFKRFEAHARYADAVRLDPDKPHFYWQSGVSREQRHRPESEWGFIAKDLPSFGSPTETFFVFHPEEQKGIQCRFGERGVVAATHYDSGMNFVAMVSGAKRYILSPPRECPKQGMFTSPHSPIYRHSLLNFAHMRYLQGPTDSGMSDEEQAWLERASRIESIETVLKKGEALYIPSHWFHYIVSLQYSAQCNVRSGINYEGNAAFGSRKTVEVCRDY